MSSKKQIAILGSTGSIGTQALDVVRAHPDEYQVYGLSAHRSLDLLVAQAREFMPAMVCIADVSLLERLREALHDLPIQCYAGDDAIVDMVTMPSVDMVLASMVGYAGLRPTLEAVRCGKTIALANKETLVVAGELITSLARQKNVALLPVDSEHSAIFQSLEGEDYRSIEKLLLTASGGPFRTFSHEQLQHVTAREALKHPNWQMGAKITIDSATMMNKGFEVIEACWLFGVSEDQIEVLVHPQSIIHSAVQFVDGSVKAQLALPDMRLPIQHAFSYPRRLKNDYPRLDLLSLKQGLTFFPPDTERFPCLQLARAAFRQAGNMPCIVNAANEVAVSAFLKDQIAFLDIPKLIERAMTTIGFVQHPDYECLVETDTETRTRITQYLCES